jgi:hypothetical protein
LFATLKLTPTTLISNLLDIFANSAGFIEVVKIPTLLELVKPAKWSCDSAVTDIKNEDNKINFFID